MKIHKNTPAEFVLNEVCFWCIQAGVAHLKNVYKEEDQNKRREWRRKLRNQLEKELESGYSADNISRIEKFIKETADPILQNEKLAFGVAQKILNLFLKYCWSLDWISQEPPDCPVDSRILGKIKWQGICWSQLDRDDYENVIKMIDGRRGVKSRSHWELDEWEGTR